MLYAIHCHDGPGASEIRESHHAAHREHLDRAPGRLLLAGPLVADDGETPIGSLFIIDAVSRAAVEAFSDADPFRIAGLWSDVRIDAFSMRVDRR